MTQMCLFVYVNDYVIVALALSNLNSGVLYDEVFHEKLPSH
jgi:hypothetical protein